MADIMPCHANALLTDEQKSLATESVSYSDVELSSTDAFAGSMLTLESNILMKLFFSGVTETMTAVIEFTDSYNNYKKIDVAASEFVANGSYKYIAVDELAVADYASVVTCTVYDGEEVHAVAQLSVEQYLKKIKENGDTDPLYDKIMKFATSAGKYLHNN